jgi:hypothetical protein
VGEQWIVFMTGVNRQRAKTGEWKIFIAHVPKRILI